MANRTKTLDKLDTTQISNIQDTNINEETTYEELFKELV